MVLVWHHVDALVLLVYFELDVLVRVENGHIVVEARCERQQRVGGALVLEEPFRLIHGKLIDAREEHQSKGALDTRVMTVSL